MLPTPSTSHVNYNHIYEPSEDSYLLLDTLSSASETVFLRNRFSASTTTPLVLEVGTGSGVVLAFTTSNANHIFGRQDVATLGTDVNSYACKATAQTTHLSTTKTSGTFLDPVIGDLTSPLRPRTIDVLVFNPPYVPTETLPSTSDPTTSLDFDRDSHLLSLSYAGGADGMETTSRLLGQLPTILSKRGVAYILLCAQNKPAEIAAEWEAREGWKAERVGSSGKKAGWEKLCVLRLWRV